MPALLPPLICHNTISLQTVSSGKPQKHSAPRLTQAKAAALSDLAADYEAKLEAERAAGASLQQRLKEALDRSGGICCLNGLGFRVSYPAPAAANASPLHRLLTRRHRHQPQRVCALRQSESAAPLPPPLTSCSLR